MTICVPPIRFSNVDIVVQYKCLIIKPIIVVTIIIIITVVFKVIIFQLFKSAKTVFVNGFGVDVRRRSDN